MVHIASGDDELRACAIFSHIAHKFGNGLLVVVSVASRVVDHKEIEFVVEYRVVDVLGIDC